MFLLFCHGSILLKCLVSPVPFWHAFLFAVIMSSEVLVGPRPLKHDLLISYTGIIVYLSESFSAPRVVSYYIMVCWDAPGRAIVRIAEWSCPLLPWSEIAFLRNSIPSFFSFSCLVELCLGPALLLSSGPWIQFIPISCWINLADVFPVDGASWILGSNHR